jgi:hypothetical protein
VCFLNFSSKVSNMENSKNEQPKTVIDKAKEGLITDFDVDTLKYISKPIGRAIYEHANVEQLTKYNSSKKVQCRTCGGKYTSSNRASHCRTQKHKLYERVTKNMKEILLK